MTEIAFPAMGSQLRFVVDAPLDPGGPPDAAALAGARAWLERAAAQLSRFRDDSELSRLNADPRAVVPAGPLLRDAVRAALWAAGRSGGLVDPTLAGALVAAGYARSRAGVAPADLSSALAAAPAPRAARPDPRERWRRVRVTDRAVARPPGVALDVGGTAKGLLADRLAARLARRYGRVAVDCGGDIRAAGAAVPARPFALEARHPSTGELLGGLALGDGAAATSGIDVNLWQRADGSFAHHLLDPSTGAAAWSGLVGVTALAPTALEAEVLAKTALLRGPAGARAILARHGGIAFHDDGGVEPVALPVPLRRPKVAA
ncbi:MAG TPA: FAD:protein FMN transferase [Baekduia sp.]|nr:FAD:protein FMN transferase [Baekduia sp.]